MNKDHLNREQEQLHRLQHLIVDALEGVKAVDVQVLDTQALSPLFERIVVASGSSGRHARALANSVALAVKESGFGQPRLEGEENGEWVVVDCGAIVLHVMQPMVRQYYCLEELWGGKRHYDAPLRHF